MPHFEQISGQTTAYVTYPSTSTDTLPTTNATLSAVQPNGQTLYQYNPAAFGRGQPPTYPYSFISNPGTYAARAYLPVPGTASASIGNPTSYEMTQLANVITQNNAVIGLPDGLNGGLFLCTILNILWLQNV